ncbi:hypothetical protein CFIO01_12856 [Colletotrichum fioriniae PJ7]|uniref:Short-chain dehydrogenase n=1 Tax=Colletotrichum fioriniae PJ7 TaxID=1445577 RepID=A0A010SIK5_9PEZI|nr:hypothetical protein CFIO01_12856 [Colletotrichum fioriniae PJ7]
MPGRLEGKNIIITGAAGGIGLESSILMFREGASVLMTDLNKELLDKALERVREVVSNVPINLETRVVDVSSKSEVEQAVNHLDSWGGLEVILNNAGVMHPRDGDAHECSAEVWNKTQKGSVINTASMVAIVGSATPQLAYIASKGAVMAHLGS